MRRHRPQHKKAPSPTRLAAAAHECRKIASMADLYDALHSDYMTEIGEAHLKLALKQLLDTLAPKEP